MLSFMGVFYPFILRITKEFSQMLYQLNSYLFFTTCLKYFANSSTSNMITAPTIEGKKCAYPGNSKAKMSFKNGMVMVNSNMTKAIVEMTITAMFFSKSTDTKLRVSDKEERIKNTLPMIKEEKAIALISPSVWPS